MNAILTLYLVLLPGLLLVLVCGLIEWIISKLDKHDKLLRWYAGDEINPGRSEGNDGSKQ